MSENDKAAMTAIYNGLDRIAANVGAAVVLDYYASKGDQSGKAVTDVGSGAWCNGCAPPIHTSSFGRTSWLIVPSWNRSADRSAITTANDLF